MRVLEIVSTILVVGSVVDAVSIWSKDALLRREVESAVELRDARFDEGLMMSLEKRRGGGGSGGGGGGGGGGGRGGSSGSSSGSSGGTGAGGGGSRNTGSASSSSGIAPSYGGGRYYGGGSPAAYRAGGRSPSGILPFALLGGGLLIFPGLWLYGAYAYNYDHPYSYHNASNASEPVGQNETLPVTCLCEMYSACGCDNNDNSTYLDDILGNGSASDQDNTLVNVANVNGSKTIVLNGTLPNGTDNSTNSDGSSTNNASSTSGVNRDTVVENLGFWVVGAIVGATVWLL